MKLVHISTIQFSIEINFNFVVVCHKHCNVRKGQKNTSFNMNLSMRLCIYKETTIMNNLPHQKISICYKIKNFILNDIKILESTLCYYYVDDYDILNL